MAEGNDALSSAQCEDDLRVMRCHTFGVPSSADGVTITGGGKLCEARAAHAGDHPIQVTCDSQHISIFRWIHYLGNDLECLIL